MKQSLGLGVIMLMCMILTSSLPNFGAVREKGSPGSRAQAALKHDFPGITQVAWTQHQGEYTAKFSLQQSEVLATYDGEGALVSTMVYSEVDAMPFQMKLTLHKKYPDFMAQHMTECITHTTHCYYFLLRRQQSQLVTWLRVKMDMNGHVSVIQKLHQRVAPGAETASTVPG